MMNFVPYRILNNAGAIIASDIEQSCEHLYHWPLEEFKDAVNQGYVGYLFGNKEETKFYAFIFYHAVIEISKDLPGINLGDIYIMNMAVHHEYRDLGIEKTIINKWLKSKIGKQLEHQPEITIKRLVIDLRETNEKSLLIFKKNDFQAIKVLRGFFKDSGEDAYRMVFPPQIESNTSPGLGARAKVPKVQVRTC